VSATQSGVGGIGFSRLMTVEEIFANFGSTTFAQGLANLGRAHTPWEVQIGSVKRANVSIGSNSLRAIPS
jgi:hypothetical protein